MTRATGSSIGGAIAGATVGALIAGLSEAALVAVERHLGLDPSLAFFALLFYGVAGVIAGVAIAAALARRRPRDGAPADVRRGVRAERCRRPRRPGHDHRPLPRLPRRLQRDLRRRADLADDVPAGVAGVRGDPVRGSRSSRSARSAAVSRSRPRRWWSWARSRVALRRLWRADARPRARRARSGASPCPTVVPEGPSVILIMVDTLRADHLSSLRVQRDRDAGDRRACRRRHAFRAYLLASVVDAAVGRDDPHLALSVVAPGDPQVRHPAQRRRHPARGDAGVGLPHHRLRQQHQRRAALQLPAGLRRVRLPRARVLLRRDRGGGAADALQPAAPDPRALFRAHEARRELLSARGGSDDARTRLDRAQRRRAPVLHVPALHGAA